MKNHVTKFIKNKNLFSDKAYFSGKWALSKSNIVQEVTNPADSSVIGTIPVLFKEEVAAAVNFSKNVFSEWAKTTAKERAKILKKWFDLVIQNQDDLAIILTLENGKPLAEAKAEIIYAASFIEWYAEEAKRIFGEIIPSPKPTSRIFVLKQPIGVTAAITPWNFPSSLVTRKVAAALAAGCTIILKPSEETPFSSLALAKLALEAGIPAGVFTVVTGKAEEIGDEFCANKIIKKISFTGSTEVGKSLIRKSADTVKRLSLELGGNAPFIVFEDADIDAAVKGLILSKHRNSGQTCICPNRVFVQEKIYRKFSEKLTSEVKKLKVGNGLEKDVNQGPLISLQGIEKVERLVLDAKKKGGKILIGGKKHKLGGCFFEPTVIEAPEKNIAAFAEEIFGPVTFLYKFKLEEEVLKHANNTRYGLAAYFYSRDIGRITRISEGLEYGMVGVNDAAISNEVAPFGGVKESGIGREGGRQGIDEYLELKYVSIGI